MNSGFSIENKVGDILARFPKAKEVFTRNGIDYCCGGQKTLGQAALEHGVDSSQVLSELEGAWRTAEESKAEEKDWVSAPLADLVDYIMHKHHTFLKSTLPKLGELTARTLTAHGANHRELFRVHKLFNTLRTELEQHLITEEEVLFPKIKEEFETGGADWVPSDVLMTVRQLENEHKGAGEVLKELRSVTSNYQLPNDACPTYAQTYQKLEALENDMFQHIHLENNILHPRLAGILAGK